MSGYFERTAEFGKLAKLLGVECVACRGSGDAPPSFDGCFVCGGSGRVLPKIITLCGSTRFKDEWAKWNHKITVETPALVFSVCRSSHDDMAPISNDEKRLLDLIHKAKIAKSDEIFVLDVGGYIGDSTRSEIAFAKSIGVPVRYLSKEPAPLPSSHAAKEKE